MMHADRHSRGRVLAITQLFPLPWDRHRATFNQQQLERLGERCQLSILVAVPWTTALRRLGEYRRANREARSANSPVRYFVYFHIPGLFRSLNSLFLFLALLLQRSYSISQDHWDRLLASWAFPDSVAVAAVGRMRGIRVTVKVHGSDINLFARHRLRRMQIRSALSACHAVVAVSAAIAERLEEIGVPGERIRVIYNGVDPERFRPMAQHESRQALSLPEEGRLVLFVGNLLVSKGCLDLLEAWKRVRERFPEVRIAFVGDGPARAEIEAFSRTVADASAIRLAGRVNHSSLAQWMNAADLVCLPSHAEGVPNVLLEAMACGRPIVATHVGGVPEVVPELAGILTPAHDIAALSHAIVVALDRRWRGDLILEHARRFSWEANVDELCETMFGAAHG